VKKPARLLLMIMSLATCLAFAQVPRARYDPASSSHAKDQKSFVEWAFSRINPGNIDYGARIEEIRQGLLDDTLRNPEFRAKALLIAALLGLFIAYWWECRTNGNLRVSTTRIVAAYHNELAVARDHIVKLTTEYGQAKRILDDQKETTLPMRAAAGKREEGGAAASKIAAVPAGPAPSQVTMEQLLIENNSLKQQVKTLTTKWQEEQQRNRKLKGE
jgi:hypothetical protein